MRCSRSAECGLLFVHEEDQAIARDACVRPSFKKHSSRYKEVIATAKTLRQKNLTQERCDYSIYDLRC